MQRLCTRFKILITSLVWVTLSCGATWAADASMEEYAVKAALVYNFVRFTEWPAETFADDTEALRVVIYGDRNLVSVFSKIDGRPAANRTIELTFAEKPADTIGCHVLFLAKTERDQWPQVAATLADSPVLTIGEMTGFLKTGGDLNLQQVKNRLRFQVNLDNVRNRGLRISSRVLKLASNVISAKNQ